MIKRLFLLLAIFAAAVSVTAQRAPGSWKLLPMSGSDFQLIRDTPDMVYYLTGNSLYSFDKESNETTYFTPGSKLSDSGISKLFYNKKGKYLLCAYSNGNMDLIFEDGKVVNLPEIKDATLNVDKVINNVSFGDGRIYVATSFGIVIYDDKDYHVIESGIYNENVKYVLELGDKILILRPSDGFLCYSLKSDRHNTLDKFTPIQSVGINEWFALDSNSYIARLNNIIWKVTLDFNKNQADFSKIVETEGAKELSESKNGYILTGSSQIVQLDEQGNVTATTAFPSDFSNQKISMWEGPASVWAGDKNGIGCYDLSSATPVVLSDKFFPESSKQFDTGFCTFTADGSKVLFNGTGNSEYHPKANPNWGIENPLLLESYDWGTGTIEPKYPIVTKQYTHESQNQQNAQNIDALFGGNGQCLIDPVDPDLIYHANNFEGLILIRNREIVYRYYKGNSPISSPFGTRVYDITFDNLGNLWICMWRGTSSDATSTTSPIKIIPKESLEIMRKNPEALTEKDASGQYKYWLQHKWVDSDNGKCDMCLLFSSKTNKGIHVRGSWGGPVIGIDTKGTTDVNDDKVVKYTAFTDQDGNVVSNPTYKTCLVEDKKGHIWMGTTIGPLVIKDLDQIADGSSNYLDIVRPKVARNDGTNYADFLLGSDQVLAIAVDCNNHKWIGTRESGLFHVNEDGTEIIEEFNKDNSPLVSNTITMIACDPHGSDVLIGTPQGQYVYSSTSAPAAEDYSNVYAYPNPVRPDYEGWITINGLMDNSLIKIADTQGHVIWSGRSEGGMAMWDGCDAAGNRVRSGVYMVYASQNADGNSSGVVTKIVVIK